MISEELLSAVLGELVVENGDVAYYVTDYVDDMHCVWYRNANGRYRVINIYELAHKCKEWLLRNNYVVSSGLAKAPDGSVEFDCLIEHFDTYYAHNSGDCYKQFLATSEPEAVFKACEWVYQQL